MKLYLFQLLKGVCFKCHRLCVDQAAEGLFLAQCKLLDEGLVAEANELQSIFVETGRAEKIPEIKAFTENALNGKNILCFYVSPRFHLLF